LTRVVFFKTPYKVPTQAHYQYRITKDTPRPSCKTADIIGTVEVTVSCLIY